MRIAAFLCLLLVLSACASPRSTCLRNASQELATVDRLIAETQANLERGYRVEREPYTTTGLDFCVGRYGGLHRNAHVGLRYCNTVETRYRDKPVAIDRTAEQRKLRELRQTRARLASKTQQALANCTARYPAG